MVECVFCIDFGSAYTKVALRPAVRENSELIPCGDAALELWAPTVVAVDWSKSEYRMEFGYKAAGIKPGGSITVFTDFKKDLFAPPGAEVPALPPLEALLGSDEFEALATKFGVLPPEVGALRHLVGSARALGGTRPERGAPPEARRQSNAKAIAAHYFKWLRSRVLETCNQLPNSMLKYEDIPLRVAVPALGGPADIAQHPGCARLREALGATGWKFDDRLFVPEPEANAIGILTKASNALTARKKIHFREMFGKGPLITVLAGDTHHPTYRATVIDVGAFTTDFAALSVDTGGKVADTSTGAGFQTEQRSLALGVTNLDTAVRTALPEDKRTALDGLARKDFAAFQENAYSDDKGYRLADRRVVGGEADRPAVEGAIADFARRVADEATAFFQQLGPVSMQELILTGGGNNIPAVRDALLKAATALPGNPVVKTHAPGIRRAQVGTPVDNLDDTFARGASALGGASIYFEQNCY